MFIKPKKKFWMTGIAPYYSAAGGLWTPASLGANLVAWYKADAQVYNTGTTLATNGQTVSGWQDQSGNGNHLIVNFTAKPVWHSAGLGGKESVTWTAASAQAMQTAATDTVTNMGTGNTASCFILGSLTTSATSVGLGFGGTGTNAGQVGGDVNSAVFFYLSATPDFTYDHAFGTGTAQAVAASTEARMGMIFDGTNATPYLNNVAGTAHALNFNWTSPGNIWVGGTGNAAGWDGEMREIILCKTALSSPDRASLDAYLLSRS